MLIINPIIYAEVSVGFKRIEELDEVLPADSFRRDLLTRDARRYRTYFPHVSLLAPDGNEEEPERS